MTIKIKMTPSAYSYGKEENGIRRVVEAYYKYLPKYDIDLVEKDEYYDLKAVHAGITSEDCDVAHLHGLYWGDNVEHWQRKANANIVKAIRAAKQITVPSHWVAETFQRDMRMTPHVVPHAIDHELWINDEDDLGYILWNKNRIGDVCSPEPLNKLARLAPESRFLTTFAAKHPEPTPNIKQTGTVSHVEMRRMVKQSSVYLSTTKETFGIGILEAMAAGKPILGWNHGGNADLVQHGVNGYLAQSGNYEDLLNGLHYCLKYKNVLGPNSRQLSLKYTWDNVAKQLSSIYHLAMIEEPPTVGVVIPVYNKPLEIVKRAVFSACQQTLKPTIVVVVDDGSTTVSSMDLIDIANQARNKYNIPVHHVAQSNQGVAVARNTGIGHAFTKYICCLDSDDWIYESFLEKCVRRLEENRQVGIAYTGLTTHMPDGKTVLSDWPRKIEFNYDRQIDYKARLNHIPTCCVFRRDVWEKTGGYRSRYCPNGAGSEDAAFWTLFGSLGYDASKVSNEGLFHYSAFEGNVSGNREYKEVDWLALYPWTRDGRHPFLSIATPKDMAHTVREYDEPIISIVVPVGPNHESFLIDSLDSIEAQSFREWEVIVVDDTKGNKLNEVLKPYPYARVFRNTGKSGAGAARNLGAKNARGQFLLFLDADDFLNPSHPNSLQSMVDMYGETGNAVYTDYIGRAIINNIDDLADNLKRNILHVDKKDDEVFIKYEASDFDCALAVKQPLGKNPNKYYIWNLISTLIPRAWHVAIGGFDEDMPTWEDWDYWIRMAKSGKCFSRLKTPALVYRFHSGSRRDAAYQDGINSRQMWQDVVKYLLAKYENEGKEKVMGCGCKGKKIKYVHDGKELNMTNTSDGDFVLAVYNHPNRGMHNVVGASTFRRKMPMKMKFAGNGLYKIDYGRHKGGGTDRFLVHKEDVRLQPHVFSVVVPKTKIEDTVPTPQEKPELIEQAEPAEPVKLTKPEIEPEMIKTFEPKEDEPETVEDTKLDNMDLEMTTEDLQKLPGIGAAMAKRLFNKGWNTKGKLLQIGTKGLTSIRGINQFRAELIIEYLKGN